MCSELLHTATVLTACVLQVYFLKLNLKSGFVTFGVLGSTKSSQQLGWIPSHWDGIGTTCVLTYTRASCARLIEFQRPSRGRRTPCKHHICPHSSPSWSVYPFAPTSVMLRRSSAAILSIVTIALSVIGLGTRKGAVMATLTAILNFLCVFIAFIVDIVLFSILRVRFLDPPEEDRSTSYGPALWITLFAVVITGVAVYSTAITAFGRSRYPRKWQTEETY